MRCPTVGEACLAQVLNKAEPVTQYSAWLARQLCCLCADLVGSVPPYSRLPPGERSCGAETRIPTSSWVCLAMMAPAQA